MITDLSRLSASADAEEAAALTADLVSHRSYPGEEAGVQLAVVARFHAHGLKAETQSVAPDRPNVIVRVENGPGPTLLLNGHVDTVLVVDGWDGDPWRARCVGDRLYGLGACDMKAGVAAAMLATWALATRCDLWRGSLFDRRPRADRLRVARRL